MSPERTIATKLGLPHRFAFGLGNDAESYDPNDCTAYKLGPQAKPDIHYMYLSGLTWPTWNMPTGEYVRMHIAAARKRSIVPMFTLYQAAAWGEKNLAAFSDTQFMSNYWFGVRTMYQRIGEAGIPVIVHLEPDLWGYFQQAGGTKVLVRSLVPEATGLGDDVAGFGRALVRLGRKLAPKAILGLSASSFGAFTPAGAPDAAAVARYLVSVGAADADIVVVETLDRDAGCFESGDCKRASSEPWYWDDAAFLRHLAWARTIRTSTGKALLWWQMPLGVASDVPGGKPGKYRDNRVKYTFSNAWRFAEAGGIGAVFGAGAPGQTTARTDGGQFKDALTKYLASGGNGLV